jgi:hypothetical protein
MSCRSTTTTYKDKLESLLNRGVYLQHSILLETYEWASNIKVLDYAGLKSLGYRGINTQAYSAFASYEENGVL